MDHWCTNRHRSTKTVPTVYQVYKSLKTVKNSQNSKKEHCVVHRVRRIHKSPHLTMMLLKS